MQLEIKYGFVPEGTVATEFLANVFYVDVGSVTHLQVFDHHAGQSGRAEAPAALIWDARQRLREIPNRCTEIVIVTHNRPDWNACWGVTLAQWIMQGKELDSDRIEAINQYSSFILAGFNPSEGEVEKSAHAVFESLMWEIDEAETDAATRDHRQIEAGLNYFQFCYESIQNYDQLRRGSFLSEDGPYGRSLLILKDDYQVYLRDLQKAEAFRFTALLSRKSGRAETVDGLKLREPTSRLFKFWARSDREHSYSKAGFPLTWVQLEPQVWIISVNPSSGYILPGLGDYLTAAESKIVPPDPQAPARQGYQVPNPWYDARSTASAFTIVASPKGGTALPEKRVEKLLKTALKVKKWKPAFERPSWLKDKFVPMGVPIACLVVLIASAYIIYRIFNGSIPCDQFKKLEPIDITIGKHIAVVVGVKDYHETGQWPDLDAPVNDAKKLMEILVGHYGFSPATDAGEAGQPASKLLISGEKPSPTQENILGHIETLANALTVEDSLLIYFSGHGAKSETETFGYWVPEDGKKEVNCVDNARIQRIVTKSKARHILIIADCCYAGKLFETEPIPPGGNRLSLSANKGEIIRMQPAPAPVHIKDYYNKPSRQIWTAGYHYVVPDGKLHSPFTACLLEALRENPDNYPTARELNNRVLKCMQGEQFLDSKEKPNFENKPALCDMQGEFVFRLQRSPAK